MQLPEQRHLVPLGMAGVNWQPLATGVGGLSLPKVLCHVCGDVSATACEMALDVNTWAASLVLGALMPRSHSGTSTWTHALEYHACQLNPSLAVSSVQALDQIIMVQ